MAFAGNVDELALLQTVRLKEQLSAEVLASQLGVGATSAQAAYDALIAQGKATEVRSGVIALTQAGLAELDDQLEAERASIDEDLFAEVVERFEPLDAEFNHLVGAADHLAGAADDLADLDRRASDIFDDVSAYVPRLARYQELLANSVEDADAYAVVWLELRREILSAAGR